MHLHDALVAHLAVAIDDDDRAVAADLAALDAADADRADVARIVELADLQLQRAVLVDVRRRAVLHDRFEQRRHVGRQLLRLVAGEAAQRRGVHDRESRAALRWRRACRTDRTSGRAPSCGRASSRSILLMTTIGRRPCANAFCVTKRVCGIGPSTASTSSSTRVDHRQHALDFAAEVGVARRVDDVDAVVAPADRGVLRQDRDAALALQRVRVHDAVGHDLARIERAGLLQELVDERGLAMIDVGDDGDVAELGRGHGSAGPAAGKRPRIVPYRGRARAAASARQRGPSRVWFLPPSPGSIGSPGRSSGGRRLLLCRHIADRRTGSRTCGPASAPPIWVVATHRHVEDPVRSGSTDTLCV